jgi:citrate synthase
MVTRKPERAAAWVDARAACAALGVAPATLYAYVSRGRIRSQPLPGSPRERRYAGEDVERLRRRAEERRDPDKAAARALQWGLPVLESSLALIDGRSLYYRGHDAIVLSRTRPVHDVASLIWTGRFDAVDAPIEAEGAPVLPDLPFVARAQAALAAASARDPQAFDLRGDAAAQTGWRILRRLTSAAAGAGAQGPTLDAALARGWRVPARGADLLRAALILCADHELNVSSFSARCVASAGSHPYAVVITGLAALEGTRHGGIVARVEAMLDSVRRADRLAAALTDRQRRGEAIDGFGHPLYRDGDPRAAELLARLRDRYAASAELAFVSRVARAGEKILNERPTIDFALAALGRVLRLPRGAPLMLFALGRAIGWIGHAIEQYASGQLIRPRARYVGPHPGSPQVPAANLQPAGRRTRERERDERTP